MNYSELMKGQKDDKSSPQNSASQSTHHEEHDRGTGEKVKDWMRSHVPGVGQEQDKDKRAREKEGEKERKEHRENSHKMSSPPSQSDVRDPSSEDPSANPISSSTKKSESSARAPTHGGPLAVHKDLPPSDLPSIPVIGKEEKEGAIIGKGAEKPQNPPLSSPRFDEKHAGKPKERVDIIRHGEYESNRSSP